MNKNYLIFIFIGLLIGAICYVGTDNLYLSIGVGVIGISYFVFRFITKLNKNNYVIYKFHECYAFINSFVISLSINNSLPIAFEVSIANASKGLKDFYDGMNNMQELEKISYLERYFPFHIYSLFVRVVNFYVNEGGNILDSSSYLINECKNEEEYLYSCQHLFKNKIIEFASMWLFTFIIVIVLRFSLISLFDKISTQIIFIAGEGFLFLFFYISLELLLNKITDFKIKGWIING